MPRGRGCCRSPRSRGASLSERTREGSVSAEINVAFDVRGREDELAWGWGASAVRRGFLGGVGALAIFGCRGSPPCGGQVGCRGFWRALVRLVVVLRWWFYDVRSSAVTPPVRRAKTFFRKRVVMDAQSWRAGRARASHDGRHAVTGEQP